MEVGMRTEVPARRSRRRVLAAAATQSAGMGMMVALAACGLGGGGQEAPAAGTQPKEITLIKTQGTEVGERAWQATFDAATAATKVRINLIREPSGSSFWDKRQAEFAAGSGPDVMYNQLNWFIVGGLKGMFIDHLPLFKRDKIDTSQYIKTEFESWQWKGRQWAIPFQSGGEGVMINRKLFDEKGVKYPTRDWTYDDLLQLCQKLNDPARGIAAIVIGQNGIQYMMGTFMRNFGGKVLNDARNKALYADDNNSIRGTELDVDLHVRYKYTPTPEITAAVPQGSTPFRAGKVAIQIDYLGGHAAAREALGADALDFAPPPKGPTGIQMARVAGNSWSILSLSKVQEAAWQVLKWTHTKEGMLNTPQMQAIAWPPLIWAAESPQWLAPFKGTRIEDAQKVWQCCGHNQVVLPEGDLAITTMNAPMNRALAGEIATRDALRQSADAVNALFAQRPKEWEL